MMVALGSSPAWKTPMEQPAADEGERGDGQRRTRPGRGTADSEADDGGAQPNALGQPSGRRLEDGVEEEEEAGGVAGLGGGEVEVGRMVVSAPP